MPSLIPHLELTQSQVAWALSLGNAPSRVTIEQLRYLRQVGVPFADDELGSGRGHHLIYGFNHLVECGLALYATRRGMKPGEAAEYLVSQRTDLRKTFCRAWKKQPETALEGEWVKSRGRLHATLGSDIQLRMHRRYSETPGLIEVISMAEALEHGGSMGDQVERFPDGDAVMLVPLSRLILEWTAWAQEAPVMKRGPTGG